VLKHFGHLSHSCIKARRNKCFLAYVFRLSDRNYLNFFVHFKIISVYDRKMTEKKSSSEALSKMIFVTKNNAYRVLSKHFYHASLHFLLFALAFHELSPLFATCSRIPAIQTAINTFQLSPTRSQKAEIMTTSHAVSSGIGINVKVDGAPVNHRKY